MGFYPQLFILPCGSICFCGTIPLIFRFKNFSRGKYFNQLYQVAVSHHHALRVPGLSSPILQLKRLSELLIPKYIIYYKTQYVNFSLIIPQKNSPAVARLFCVLLLVLKIFYKYLKVFCWVSSNYKFSIY